MEDKTDISGGIPSGLAVVGTYPGFQSANEHALVVLSMNLPYWMFRAEGRFLLCVEEVYLESVQEEIGKFDHDSSLPRATLWPDMRDRRELSPGAFVVFGYTLLVFFVNQQRHSGWLVERGALDAVALLQHGEWWRMVTALTLHADVAHLSANVLGGVFFAVFVNRGFGVGLGWVLILLSGILGNLSTAMVYFPAEHHSMGASTAIFGALGLLVGDALVAGIVHGRFEIFRTRVIPVVGGFVLLALLGAGDVRTDTVAHFGGFLMGFCVGFAAARILEWKQPGKLLDGALLFTALIIPAVAWTTAR